jgi:hypothetical protein
MFVNILTVAFFLFFCFLRIKIILILKKSENVTVFDEKEYTEIRGVFPHRREWCGCCPPKKEGKRPGVCRTFPT